MEYKHTYKGFIAFFIGFIIALGGFAFLSGLYFYQHIVRVSISVVTVGVTLLTFIIYKTQYIYWFNGITYDDALEAGEIRRKEYAMAHFRLFTIFSSLQVMFSLIMGILAITQWVDFAVSAVALCMVGIGTLKIKL